MAIELSHKSEFNVAGLSAVRKPNSPEFSFLWDRLFESGLFTKLMAIGTTRTLWVCYVILPDGSFSYMAGVELVDLETVK